VSQRRWIIPWVLLTVFCVLTLISAALANAESTHEARPMLTVVSTPKFDLEITRGTGYACADLESLGSLSRYTISVEGMGSRISIPVTSGPNGYFLATALVIANDGTSTTLPLNDVLSPLWTSSRDRNLSSILRHSLFTSSEQPPLSPAH
jgi:hypothetical protein